MPDQDFSPRAARHLRGFGRRRVDDDVNDERASEEGPSEPPAASAPEPSPPLDPPEPATPLTPGSIWGPQLTATESESPAPPSTPTPPPADEPPTDGPPPPPAGGDGAQAPQAGAEASVNPKHRRRAGERPADPDSVDIGSDDSHAWWAQRDDLDQLVNPKKRGAAARAQRAAREAFAPSGATNVAANAYAQNDPHQYSWDPASVYTWASEGEPVAEEPSGSLPQEATPWDVLGLTSEATWDEVLKRHRRLAKEHHPDRHAADSGSARSEAEQRMAEINAAFGDLRRIYRLTDGI